jgi:hypothetical protein
MKLPTWHFAATLPTYSAVLVSSNLLALSLLLSSTLAELQRKLFIWSKQEI